MHDLLGNGSPDIDRLLSSRESEVAELVVQGFTNVDIAETLCISKRTVESHVRSIKQKLRLTNRYQVIVWGVRQSSTACAPSPSGGLRRRTRPRTGAALDAGPLPSSCARRHA